MPDVLQTKPVDWKYVSEGGATIVYSYKGPSQSDFNGTVLRLRKAPVVIFRADPVPTTSEEEIDDPTIEFQARCMERLIPPEHLPRLETVWLSRPWLQALVELQDHARPESRRQKDQVDLAKRRGVLATDLVGGNWLAVEIKVNFYIYFGGSSLIVFLCLSRSGDSCLPRRIFPRKRKPQRCRPVDSVCTHSSKRRRDVRQSQLIVLWTYSLEMRAAFARLYTPCGTLGSPAMQ